jgi:hypothetical protein
MTSIPVKILVMARSTFESPFRSAAATRLPVVSPMYILVVVNAPEPSFSRIVTAFERDVELSTAISR